LTYTPSILLVNCLTCSAGTVQSHCHTLLFFSLLLHKTNLTQYRNAASLADFRHYYLQQGSASVNVDKILSLIRLGAFMSLDQVAKNLIITVLS